MTYTIEGQNQAFKSLSDAKYHASHNDTPNEHIRFYREPTYIIGRRGDNIVSLTLIKVDDKGNVTFGRTEKYSEFCGIAK